MSVEVILVLLGTVVGAVGSTLGSVIANRRELTRASRIRIYQQIVPPLLDSVSYRGQEPIPPERIQELYRECVLAGRYEQKWFMDRVFKPWHGHSAIDLEGDTDPEGEWTATPASLAVQEHAREEFAQALLDFHQMVEKKIR